MVVFATVSINNLSPQVCNNETSHIKRLTNTIASMGATNVQIALVPNPEDSQQLDVKAY